MNESDGCASASLDRIVCDNQRGSAKDDRDRDDYDQPHERVREEVKGTWAEKENETPIEAVSQFIGGGLFGLLMWWGNGKMRMAVDDMDSMSRRSPFPHSRLRLGNSA